MLCIIAAGKIYSRLGNVCTRTYGDREWIIQCPFPEPLGPIPGVEAATCAMFEHHYSGFDCVQYTQPKGLALLSPESSVSKFSIVQPRYSCLSSPVMVPTIPLVMYSIELFITFVLIHALKVH